MITISRFDLLNPLDSDFELGTFVLSFINRKISTLSQTVDTSAPVNEKLKLLLDFVPDRPKNILAHVLGIVRYLRLKFAGVLVDALNLLLVEVDLEVVGEHLEYSAWRFWISGWLFWKERDCV